MSRPSEFRTFTPKQYEAYQDGEVWMSDNFESDDAYESYWCDEIEKMVSNSLSKFGDSKKRCRALRQQMENRDKTKINLPLRQSHAIAAEILPFLRAEVLDHVALLCGNYPIMQFISPSDAMNLYVAGLSQLKDMTLKMNGWAKMIFNVVYDACSYPYGCFTIKTEDKLGPFGQRENVSMKRIDPNCVHVDSRAKEYDWNAMAYLVIEHEMEIGEIRKKWPMRGFLIPDNATDAPEHDLLKNQPPSRNLIFSIAYNEENTGMARSILKVKEAWIKDPRMQFEAEYEEEAITDKDGNMEMVKKLKLDGKGKVVGKWTPAYPKGRCIIIANNKFVLADFANPYSHGEAPINFVTLEPSHDLDGMSFAEMLAVPIRKENDLQARAFSYAQTEIERPMVMESGAFPVANYNLVRGNSREVLQKFSSKEFARMPPTPLPDFTFPMIAWYQQATEQLSGTSGVSRGNVSDGAQLSAQAIGSLQDTGASRVKMHAEYLADSIVKAGRQLLWCIRDSFDESVQLQVMDAFNKTMVNIDWSADKAVFADPTTQQSQTIDAEEDYLVEIQPGTGLPGAQQANSSMLLTLHDKGIVDDIAVLQGMRVPGWQEIVSRKQQQKTADIFTDAAGRGLGLTLKSDMRQNGREGGATKAS